MDIAIAKCADTALKGESGTAMNRGLLNAAGLAYAAKLAARITPAMRFGEETHRRMFADDFERIKDTNEDATNYHFVWGDALIQYVQDHRQRSARVL